MKIDVAAEVRRMMKMTVPELRERYAAEFGEQTRSGNKDFLIKRVTWRMQANAEGGLSERAMKRAMEIASDADLRVRWPAGTGPSTLAVDCDTRAATVVRAAIRPGRRAKAGTGIPMTGAVITRRYKDRTIAVKVLDDGFEYEGSFFKSLSAVAKAVTGSHWNGNIFFGITPARKTGKPAKSEAAA